MSERVGPWERRSRRVAYENEWIAVYDDEVVRPDGERGVYGVVHPRFLAAGIVALDGDGSVLLVGQHRYTLDLYTWGIPGGGVPLDEDALEGASGNSQRRPAPPRPPGSSSPGSRCPTRSPTGAAWCSSPPASRTASHIATPRRSA